MIKAISTAKYIDPETGFDYDLCTKDFKSFYYCSDNKTYYPAIQRSILSMTALLLEPNFSKPMTKEEAGL